MSNGLSRFYNFVMDGCRSAVIWLNRPDQSPFQRVGIEVVKLGVLSVAISSVVRGVFPQGSSEHNQHAMRSILFAPLRDELIFHGLLLTGIKEIQAYYSRRPGWAFPPRDEALEQKIIRIAIVTLLFGFRQGLRPGAYFILSNMMYGVSWALIKEKTNSLAIPLILHCSYKGATHLFSSSDWPKGFLYNSIQKLIFGLIMKSGLYLAR